MKVDERMRSTDLTSDERHTTVKIAQQGIVCTPQHAED